jgi:hypothetical protein
VLGYNVAQSSQCTEGVKAAFDRYGADADAKVVFSDASLNLGTTDVSVQVQKMTDAKVDLVTTCMDQQGVVTLAKELKKQSSNAIQFLPNGYDHDLLTEFGDLFEGSYLYPGMAPLEMADPPKGMERMKAAFDTAGIEPSENAIIGWINADLFVAGLRKVADDPTRQGVIDAINSMTDWDAGGLVADVNWTKAHTQRPELGCYVYLRIESSKFVPVWGKKGKPFVCFDLDRATGLEPADIRS